MVVQTVAHSNCFANVCALKECDLKIIDTFICDYSTRYRRIIDNCFCVIFSQWQNVRIAATIWWTALFKVIFFLNSFWVNSCRKLCNSDKFQPKLIMCYNLESVQWAPTETVLLSDFLIELCSPNCQSGLIYLNWSYVKCLVIIKITTETYQV